MDTQKEVMLGGRLLVTCSTDDMTFDQYAWIQQASDKAGLGHELVQRIQPVIERAVKEEVALSETEANDLTNAIISRCYEKRAHLDVLSGILVEKGKVWTYEGAQEMREWLGQLKGRVEIEKANVILAQAVIGFFWSGLDSMLTSLKSSDLVEIVRKLEREVESEAVSDLVSSES